MKTLRFAKENSRERLVVIGKSALLAAALSISGLLVRVADAQSSAYCFNLQVFPYSVVDSNDLGQLLLDRVENGKEHGYLKTAKGLVSISGHGLENGYSVRAMNRLGQVVGVTAPSAQPGGDQTEGFFWDHGRVVIFPAQADGLLVLSDINDSGTIAGYEMEVNQGQRVFNAFVLTPKPDRSFDKKILSTNLNFDWTSTHRSFSAINNSNIVVGSSGFWSFFQPSRAAIGKFVGNSLESAALLALPLVPQGDESTVANAINDRGQVVGTLNSANSATTSALLWENGMVTDLGTLGGSSSLALDINNFGVAIGQSNVSDATSAKPVRARAFVYAGGKMRDLNSMLCSGSAGKVLLRSATTINNLGQIGGTAISSTGENLGSFYLTPTAYLSWLLRLGRLP